MKKIFTWIILFNVISFTGNSQIIAEKQLASRGHVAYCLAYSADGKMLASGGDDEKVIVYDVFSGKELMVLEGLKGIPLSVTFSPDGQMVAAGGKDNQVTVWNLNSRQVILTLKGHKEQIMGLKFSPDNKYIASASLDKKVIYWNLTTGQPDKTLIGHDKEVTCVDISPNGAFLVSGGADGNIKLWDLKTGQVKYTIPAHTNWIRGVAFSPDGSMIASGGDDKRVNLWDAYNGSKVNTFLGHRKWVQTIAYSPDGNYLISGGHDNQIFLTDLRSGKMLFRSDKQSNFVLSIAFNPNGQNFASTELYAKEVKVWDARTLNIKPLEQHLAQKAASTSGLAPKVEIILPAADQQVTSASLKVAVKITSESSLRSIEYVVNGKVLASKDRSELMNDSGNESGGQFEEPLVLNEGVNTIQVKAQNIVGEGVSKTISVTYQAVAVKSLSWIQPVEKNMTTSLGSYMLMMIFNVFPANSVAEIFVNGVSQGNISDVVQGEVASKNITLSTGDNTIVCKTTINGKTTDSEIRVIKLLEAEKPQVVWINPTVDTLSNISVIRLKSNVLSSVPIEKVEVMINGLNVYTKLKPGINQYLFDQPVQLSAGINTIQIIATNSGGAVQSTPRVITFEPPTKTNVSWVYPADDFQTFNGSIALKACIQSKSTVTKLQVFNNGIPVIDEINPAAGTSKECTIDFSRDMKLNEGVNELKIVAENAGGITNSETKRVTYIVAGVASVEWISPATAQNTTSEGSANLNICVNSNNPVSSVSFIVNGQIINTITGPVKGESGCQYPIQMTLPLSKGSNTITTKVVNAAGESISSPVIFDFKSSNPYKFALIIGNEDYSSFQTDLASESDVDFALNDARSFKKACIEQLGIQEDNIIYHENARYIDMRKAIKKMSSLIQVTSGKAEIVVYYAGHGFPDEKTKEPYLVPVDGSGSDLELSGIKLTDFYNALTEFPSQRVTVFIDACFSGGARNQGLVAARGVKITPKEVKEEVKKKLVVFTASSGNESSLPYKEKEHGLFTYYLVSKLEASHGNISYKELSDYISEQVAIKSVMVNNKEQQPQTNVSPEVQSVWMGWKMNE